MVSPHNRREHVWSPTIRELKTLRELELALRLEKEVWELSSEDTTPLTLAAALSAAGSMFLGAFDRERLVGFAFAFPSIESRRLKFHSHLLAVHPSHRGLGLGVQLKCAQRKQALDLGIKEMTWTFDPLRATNAHLNFARLGVICSSYKIDFYGEQTSGLDIDGTDRLWVTWNMDDIRVEKRLSGYDCQRELLRALQHAEPVVRFDEDGRPVEATNLEQAFSEQRIAIEIPNDIGRIQCEQVGLVARWRLATRKAFTEALKAGFVIKEFCRCIRGREGSGAYLLER